MSRRPLISFWTRIPNRSSSPSTRKQLITHPKVQFVLEDRSYFLERGKAYEVNNRIRHGVTNHSDIDRVHLIFDYYQRFADVNSPDDLTRVDVKKRKRTAHDRLKVYE